MHEIKLPAGADQILQSSDPAYAGIAACAAASLATGTRKGEQLT